MLRFRFHTIQMGDYAPQEVSERREASVEHHPCMDAPLPFPADIERQKVTFVVCENGSLVIRSVDELVAVVNLLINATRFVATQHIISPLTQFDSEGGVNQFVRVYGNAEARHL